MKIVVEAKAKLLVCGGNSYRCTIGRGGVINASSKSEGDGATPAGEYKLRRVHYRADRIDAPRVTGPQVRSITPDDGWCDDPAHHDSYNRLVQLPHAGSFENLWRDDHVYDCIAEIGYNDDPPIAAKGSAIFMHIAREGYSPTEGCIALAKADILEVLDSVDETTTICILS